MSESFQLIKSIEIMLSNYTIRGQPAPDNLIQDIATRFERLTVSTPQGFGGFQNPGISFGSAQGSQSLTTGKPSKGKTLLEYNEFVQLIQSGQCVCSYKMLKGETKDKICGAKVKEMDQSLPLDQQKCTSHDPKRKAVKAAAKAGEVPPVSFQGFTPGINNGSFPNTGGFIPNSFPSRSPLGAPLTGPTPQPMGVIPGANTLPPNFDPNSFLAPNSLGVQPTSFQSPPPLSQQNSFQPSFQQKPVLEFFTRNYKDQAIWFTTDSTAKKLYFSKNLDGSYKCLGKVEANIPNKPEPLSDEFASRCNMNLSESELTWLVENGICSPTSPEENDDEENDDVDI